MRVAATRFRRASIVNLVRTWRGLKSTARHAIMRSTASRRYYLSIPPGQQRGSLQDSGALPTFRLSTGIRQFARDSGRMSRK